MERSVRGRGGMAGRGRPGVSPLLRHSPVRPPSGPDDDGPSPLAARGGRPAAHELYIGNWPDSVHEQEIRALFAKYAIPVLDVSLHRKQNQLELHKYAFVELTCAADVERAVDLLHGGKVMGNQITVRPRRPGKPRRRPALEPEPEPELVVEMGEEMEEETEEGDIVVDRTPAVRRGIMRADRWQLPVLEPDPEPPEVPPRDMPNLVYPGWPGDLQPTQRDLRSHLQHRRRHGDREEEMSWLEEDLQEVPPRAKRCCVASDSSGATDSDLRSSGHSSIAVTRHDVALEASASLSDRIRQRLRAPLDVVVANFPAGTPEMALMNLFNKYAPINVRIMVNYSGHHPDDFTYAYVTLQSRMAADEAVLELDGRLYNGHRLVVETRTC